MKTWHIVIEIILYSRKCSVTVNSKLRIALTMNFVSRDKIVFKI